MEIICPRCGFERDIDPALLPPVPLRMTCPQCEELFSWEMGKEPESIGPSIMAAETDPAEAPRGSDTSVPAPPEPAKAGFWIRAVAFVIDSLLVSLLQFVLSFLLLQSAELSGARVDPQNLSTFLILELFGTVLALAYFVFFTGYGGQTPGKMALRLRVVRTDGSPVGYGRAFLREVPGKLLSGLLLGIGYLLVAFHPKKQGLHDIIADTYVIKLSR